MIGVESEWQFDAVHMAPVQRWLEAQAGAVKVVKERTRNQRDVYLDTSSLSIYRAGRTLRLRRIGRQAEATLKATTPPQGALRERAELNEALATQDLAAPGRSEGEVGRRVRALTGRQAVAALFEVRTRRQTFGLELGGERVGELALDQAVIGTGDRGGPVRLKRVEVEVDDPGRPEIAEFVERLRVDCRLTPATMSKFEAGFLANGLVAPAPPDVGATEVGPESTTGELAFAILRRHFAAVVAHEPGTRLGDDPEELHDMRVSSRRIRAVLSLFSSALPVRSRALQAEMKWLGAVLGAVRDLDVQIEQAREWADASTEAGALHELVEFLEGRRRLARAALLEALDSRRYARLMTSFESFLRAGPLRRSTASRTPAVIAAPDVILARYRKVRRRGRRLTADSDPADFHALRIQCKRLRYALESVTDLYGKPARRAAGRLAAVQDVLGAHQDAYQAIRQLRSIATQEGLDLSPATVFGMGEVAERYAQRAARLRGELPAVFGRLGRPMSRLRKAMKAARQEALSRPPARPEAPALVRPVTGARRQGGAAAPAAAGRRTPSRRTPAPAPIAAAP